MTAPANGFPIRKAPRGIAYHSQKPILLVAPNPSVRPLLVAQLHAPLFYPALGRFAVELQGLHAAAEELESADGDGRDREDAAYREADVQGEKPTHDAEGCARDQTGHARRERVDRRLALPASACLVPMHVGTRDSVNRVRASREGLLGYGRYHRGADEQRENPTHLAGVACEGSDEDAKPGGGKQRVEEPWPGRRQHTRPTKPRQMQRRPPLVTQSQHR